MESPDLCIFCAVWRFFYYIRPYKFNYEIFFLDFFTLTVYNKNLCIIAQGNRGRAFSHEIINEYN